MIVKQSFTVLMLSATLVVASVLSPCLGQGLSCAMARARQMDCCSAKAGIGAPPCCTGKQQVRNAIAVTPDRPAQKTLAASAVHVMPVVVAFVDPTRVFAPQRIDVRTAPPGGTLVAQHTSLLL